MKSLTAFLGAVGMVCCSEISAQVSTIQPGNWNSPSTWSGGIIPDSSQSTIIIAHAVVISDTVLTVDEVILQDTLTILNDAEIILAYSGTTTPDLQIVSGGILNVSGKLSCKDNATLSGTNSSNTFFNSGAVYQHQYFSTAGEPPTALWDINSTLIISGYRTSRSLNTAGWTQFFGNVEYNCPNQQTSAYVEMLGNLRNIGGNFNIRNTNGGVLRLTLDRTTLNTINIGGNFSIDGNSEVWFSREANTVIHVGGNFEYQSTATPSTYLTTLGTCQVNVGGNVLVNTPGILRFASSGGGTGTLRFKKDFVLQSGSLAVLPTGSGFIECNGDSIQSIRCNGPVSSEITFVINGSAGSALQNSIGESSVDVITGELVLPPIFNLQGDLTIGVGGSLNSNEGTLLLSGSLDQTLDLRGDTLHHITITKSSGSSLTLGSMVNLSGNLSIQSQNTDVITNGNLTLLSTSDDGHEDASIGFLPDGSEVIGDVTIQRFMSGEGRLYRYLSSPVTNATVASMQDDFPVTGIFENPTTGSGLISTNPSCYWYDESLTGSLGWVPYPVSGLAQDNVLTVGRGYASFIRQASAPTVWDVTGPINHGELNLNVSFTNTDDVSNDGWNLIGNPYPSAIDWDSETGWIKTNIDNEIAVRDNGAGTILYWDGDIGSLGNGRIAKGQSFWVKTNGDDPSLIINENAKTNLTTPFYKKPASDLDYFELTLTGAGHTDKAYLRLRQDAAVGLDPTDVQKMSNDFINVAFLTDSIPIAITATNVLNCDESIPLSCYFQMTSNGSILPALKGVYTFSCNTKGLFNSATIKILDSFTNELITIKHDYIFSITDDPASFARERFSLYIEAEHTIESLVIHHDSVFCAQSPYTISVDNLSGEVRSLVFLNDVEQKSILLSDTTTLEITLDPALFSGEINEVSAVIQNVCYADLKKWTVTSFIEPVISQKENKLVSNYSSGNQWYFENSLIGNYQTVEPTNSGVYSLQVNCEKCQGTSSYNFLYQNNEVQYFPNPVQDNINIISPLDAIITVVLITDTSGKVVKEFKPDTPRKDNSISLTELSPGFYVVNVHTSKGLYPLKMVKE